jgi:hypothetical protein
MDFKISLRVDLPEGIRGAFPPELLKQLVDSFSQICGGLKIQMSHDFYNFYKDELQEMKGEPQIGINFLFERKVKDAVNYHYFSCIFESVAAMLNRNESFAKANVVHLI